MWGQALACAVGLWLMAAPDVVGYGGAAAVNDRIVGPVAASFACVALWQVTRSLRWVNVLLGSWMALAPAVLGYGHAAAANDVLSGVGLFAFSLLRGRLTHSFGGGWKILFVKSARSR